MKTLNVPPYFTDPVKEHDSVRKNTGLFNLNSFGKIEVKGKDRIQLLHGLTTNDVRRLSEGQGLYTLIPTVKGKIASEAIVYYFPEKLLLVVHPELREKTISLLNRYKIGSVAQIEDLTDQIGLFSLQGPKTDSLLTELIHQPFPPLPPYHYISAKIGNWPVYIIENGWSGEKGVDMIVLSNELEEVWNFILENGKPYEIAPVGMEAFETLRIEAGLPLYGKELSEDIIPQEAGLEAKGISYTKGCYIGQETIARLHYLGHTNRSLVGFYLEREIPVKGDKILSGDKILGSITSAVFSPTLNKIIAMGYLHREFIKPGTKVEVDHQGEKISATVTELPFYRSQENVGKIN